MYKIAAEAHTIIHTLKEHKLTFIPSRTSAALTIFTESDCIWFNTETLQWRTKGKDTEGNGMDSLLKYIGVS